MVQTIETLKEKFKSGSFPTQQDYHDVFESFFSKNDSITTDEIKGVGDDSDKTLTQILATIPELPEGLDEFIAKVNSFLNDTDLADETINKWKEIESFLSGITDTQTLTGLLADLKAEILAEIPEQKNYTAGEGIEISEDGVISATGTSSNKKFCEIIDDLDASDAEVGTIALYGGPTNDKYTHGFIYEKGEGGEVKAVLKSGFRDTFSKVDIPAGEYAFTGETMEHRVDLGTGSYMRMCYQLTGPDGKLYWTTASPDDTDLTWVNIGPDLGTKYGEESRIPYQWQSGASGTIGSSPSWTPLNVMNVIN